MKNIFKTLYTGLMYNIGRFCVGSVLKTNPQYVLPYHKSVLSYAKGNTSLKSDTIAEMETAWSSVVESNRKLKTLHNIQDDTITAMSVQLEINNILCKFYEDMCDLIKSNPYGHRNFRKMDLDIFNSTLGNMIATVKQKLSTRVLASDDKDLDIASLIQEEKLLYFKDIVNGYHSQNMK